MPPRVIAAALFAVLSIVMAVVPASADTSGNTSSEVAAASWDACMPWGCYVSHSRFTGFYHVPSATPLCSASASGAGTSSCGVNRSCTVTPGVDASVAVTLIKDSLSTTGPRGGYLYGVPEYKKHTFLVRHRALGGEGANDAVPGDGWIGFPCGMKCIYKDY